MFNMFDADGNGSITMEEFIEALSVLSKRGNVADKIKLSFDIWDMDGDGKISRTELFEVIKSSLEV